VATGGTPAAPARPGAHDGGGYRDTIESILIAFILAFIFRAFVVEAFVIPTGSMAPTLLGAHARFICDDCGYRFDVNYSAGGDDQNIPPSVRHNEFARIDCPNCAHTVHDPRDSNSQEPVEIHYGDRILVLKYAYLFGNEPSRWDVVVFKSPDSPVEGTSWYATNFIKRLVGKPGETVMILDGDVYVSTTGASDPAAFKVQPKPRNVQEALWRVVYDNEFLPKAPPDGAADRGQRWTADEGSGWDVGTADAPRRVFTFDAAAGAAGAVTFDNGANEGRAFTDWLAYAQVEQARNLSRLNNVSDVKLSLLYHRRGGDGPLRLQLTKLEDTFTAEVAPAGVKLFRKRGAPAGPDDLGEEVASAAAPAGLGGGPALLEFTNVDYRVTLRVAGRDVLAASYDPDVAALRAAHDAERKLPKPTVRIAAAGQACDLSDVSLWRDVYYTNGPRRRPYDSQDGITWGIPEQPIALGADEYFVLGDNTVISKDARFWSTPINLPEEGLEAQAGVVPGRFLLGKAFFVYWPAGFRTAITMRRLSAIPNFGDMRLIE
jgi:signal peptidase I